MSIVTCVSPSPKYLKIPERDDVSRENSNTQRRNKTKLLRKHLKCTRLLVLQTPFTDYSTSQGHLQRFTSYRLFTSDKSHCKPFEALLENAVRQRLTSFRAQLHDARVFDVDFVEELEKEAK